MITRNAEIAKSIATTIVVMNNTFSNPRRVVCTDAPSVPPRAEPTLALVCWSKIEMTRMTARIICAQGSIECIIPMTNILAQNKILSK